MAAARPCDALRAVKPLCGNEMQATDAAET
jgi:hypothetical protein